MAQPVEAQVWSATRMTMDAIFMALVVVAVAFLLLWQRVRTSGTTNTQSSVIPAGATLTPAPLLTEQQVVLYNLIRLTVQDHYLVFAQVPLWAFVRVDAAGKARAEIFCDIALKPVDFVLVHPGTRQVAQVVQVEDAARRNNQGDRLRIVTSVLGAAGIKLVTLRSQQSYAVPVLASLLGLDPEDS